LPGFPYASLKAFSKAGCYQGCQMAYFQTKILIWVNFGGTRDRSCWYILWPLGLFYVHLVYFTAIWSI
jgi:hypothetical protein